MADFENILPPPGIAPGIPNSFEGSDMVFVEGINPLPPNTPLVPYNEDVSIPSVPTGGFSVNYDQNNPFDMMSVTFYNIPLRSYQQTIPLFQLFS